MSNRHPIWDMRVPATMYTVRLLAPSAEVSAIDAYTARLTFPDAYLAVSFATGNDGWPSRLAAPITDLSAPVTLIITLDAEISDEARRIFELHVDYPHNPGYLIDCPACESRCHCAGTDYAECVYHATDNPYRSEV